MLIFKKFFKTNNFFSFSNIFLKKKWMLENLQKKLLSGNLSVTYYY